MSRRRACSPCSRPYSGNPRHREIAEAGMGYLASPAVLDAYAFLPDVLLAERSFRNEPVHVTIVGPKDDPRSAPSMRRRLPIPSPTSAPSGGTKREGQLAHHDVDLSRLPRRSGGLACTRNFCSLPVPIRRHSVQLDRLQRAIAR